MGQSKYLREIRLSCEFIQDAEKGRKSSLNHEVSICLNDLLVSLMLLEAARQSKGSAH